MSSNKTTININDIPRFNRKQYKEWATKMESTFLITYTKGVIDGTVTPPAGTEPAEPTSPANNADALHWGRYTTQLQAWQIKSASWKQAKKAYNEDNAKAKGLFSVALDIGIWEQCKDKTAKEIWDWIKEKYSKETFIEILEDFRYIRDLKFDLSDPNPQIATFMHRYQRLPMERMTLQTTPTDGQPAATADANVRIVHQSMACLILLSNLPLATSNVGNTSVYQSMFETIMKETQVAHLLLDDVCAAIRNTWASRFGHFKPSERPKKGTFYYNEPKGKGRADERPPPRPQAQRNTAIKGKGPAPKHSEQQQQQKGPAASNSRGKRPFRRSNCGGQKKASARVAAPSSDFLIASAAITIADQPSRPAPTAHTVAHIAPTGITTRREFEQGSSRLPGTAPYPTFQ